MVIPWSRAARLPQNLHKKARRRASARENRREKQAGEKFFSFRR
jgi:hypothetical protein